MGQKLLKPLFSMLQQPWTRKITANTLEQNISAQRLLEKIGFILEGKKEKLFILQETSGID